MLPGFDQSKARTKFRKGSRHKETVRLVQSCSKQEAQKWFDEAVKLEKQDRPGHYGGFLGSNPIRVYWYLVFRSLFSGIPCPSYETIGRELKIGKTTVAKCIKRLSEVRLINVVNRFDIKTDEKTGKAMPMQTSNAYFLLPPSQWKRAGDEITHRRAPPAAPGQPANQNTPAAASSEMTQAIAALFEGVKEAERQERLREAEARANRLALCSDDETAAWEAEEVAAVSLDFS